MLMNALRKSLHEVVIPEIKLVRAENSQITTTLEITNKRLDDLNAQLADQSRRIDTTNQRIDAVHSDLITRIDTTNDRLNRLYEVIVRRGSGCPVPYPLPAATFAARKFRLRWE